MSDGKVVRRGGGILAFPFLLTLTVLEKRTVNVEL